MFKHRVDFNDVMDVYYLLVLDNKRTEVYVFLGLTSYPSVVDHRRADCHSAFTL